MSNETEWESFIRKVAPQNPAAQLVQVACPHCGGTGVRWEELKPEKADERKDKD